MFRNFVGACFLIVIPTAVMAQQPKALCRSAQNSAEEVNCMNRELADTDLILGRYLQAAQKQIDSQSPGKPLLSTTQEVWLKYRKASCGDVYIYREAETFRNRAELECEIEITRSRIHELWSSYLQTRGLSAILPEPRWDMGRFIR